MRASARRRATSAALLAAIAAVVTHCGSGTEPVSAPFESISAGLLHTCAVTADGEAYCWGWNRDGQLGDGSASDRDTPVRVESGEVSAAEIEAGGGHTCALAGDGAVYCWGLNLSGQLGDGTSATRPTVAPVSGGLQYASVSAGGAYTCGVTTGEAAHCWGFNEHGQLGDGSQSNSSSPVAVSGGLAFASVSAGSFHSCGVTTGGDAYCWGRNDLGQLGNGTATDATQPALVSGGHSFASVSAGFMHTCGLTTDGVAMCWGSNEFGQLGGGTAVAIRNEPAEVTGDIQFAVIDAGASYTCGVSETGQAFCWGLNQSGQLGATTGDTCIDTSIQLEVVCSLLPAAVSGALSFASLSAGTQHTCGLTTDRVAYCWGLGTRGQLGNGRSGETVLSVEPVRVEGQM